MTSTIKLLTVDKKETPMPRPVNYSDLENKLSNLDEADLAQADPNSSLENVELANGIAFAQENYGKIVKDLQQSLGDALVDDIKSEITSEIRQRIAEDTIDGIIELLDGPANSVKEAVEQGSAKALSNAPPEVQNAITDPEYQQLVVDAFTAAF